MLRFDLQKSFEQIDDNEDADPSIPMNLKFREPQRTVSR